MKKYNNIANHMGLIVIFVNILFPVMIVSILLFGQGIDNIIGALSFTLIVVTNNVAYFYLLDQWYFTYYDEHHIMQKWLKKRKRIKFDEVNFMYFVDNLVIISEHSFNIKTDKINMTAKRRIKRILKDEICIVINPHDRFFPTFLLDKCKNAKKVDFFESLQDLFN